MRGDERALSPPVPASMTCTADHHHFWIYWCWEDHSHPSTASCDEWRTNTSVHWRPHTFAIKRSLSDSTVSLWETESRAAEDGLGLEGKGPGLNDRGRGVRDTGVGNSAASYTGWAEKWLKKCNRWFRRRPRHGRQGRTSRKVAKNRLRGKCARAGGRVGSQYPPHSSAGWHFAV